MTCAQIFIHDRIFTVMLHSFLAGFWVLQWDLMDAWFEVKKCGFFRSSRGVQTSGRRCFISGKSGRLVCVCLFVYMHMFVYVGPWSCEEEVIQTFFSNKTIRFITANLVVYTERNAAMCFYSTTWDSWHGLRR